jgi:hypothetical protein
MAFNNDQFDPSLPISDTSEKTSIGFLPKYFRTSANQKFLNATIDQMISEGDVEKVSAFIGRKTFEPYRTSDKYLEGATKQREDYQFEPAVIIKDDLDNVTFFKDYPDFVNQLAFFNIDDTDHNKINSQEFYAWNPHFDWDKFVNYRDYYWLPGGPVSVPVAGQADTITSTYTVSIVDDADNRAYLFTPDGLTRNPNLKLYRGQTYIFEIDCPNYGIAFKTVRETGDSYFYTTGVSTGNQYVEKGTIEFTVPVDAPNIIYYVSQSDVNTGGIFKVYDITDASSIDVENEIIGKKDYTTANDILLSNGMKVFFQGRVTPEKYATGNWYIEGVGSAIKLVKETDLATPSSYSSTAVVEFDNEQFDSQGFDVSANIPLNKEYITINRSSKDLNPWTRFNRWFHKDVIDVASQVNGIPTVLDQSQRATRPIIEFESDLKLWKFGTQFKQNVNLVDSFTRDVFSTIEGSLGYNVDGVDLLEGMRVLFTADPDVQVNGRIFRVAFVTHLGTKRITLIQETDTDPVEGETVLSLDGVANKGKMFYYNGSTWLEAQAKTTVNQAPLFDIFNESGVSYGDESVYQGTTFAGTRIFGYKPGTNIDTELGFGISYKNIGNIGDIVFDFNLQKDSFIYKKLADIVTITLDKGYLKKSTSLANYSFVNGWEKAVENSKQYVVRQFDGSDRINFFPVDVYNRSALLEDLEVKVFVNGKIISSLTEYEIVTKNDIAYVQLVRDLTETDSVFIKTSSSAKKNDNGYYEIPSNLESNPNNLALDDCTLGEVINHLKTIANNREDFFGSVPGSGNLRDLAGLSAYGKKIIQHSGPLTPIIYHFTDKEHNIVKALRFAKDEYSKFKRNFIRVATTYGFDGITRIHLDLILKELVKDKANTMPFFFTDMAPFGGNFVFDQQVIDDSITEYPLTFDFNLDTLSDKAVLVYLNEEQLIHGRDYEFFNVNFVRILTPLAVDDELKIVQYENTNGCYIPPTPTKLGLYPLYEPKKYVDDTLVDPIEVIQGHDGSVIATFGDYRDDLILELERRIYNNIKIKYNPDLFDITDFVGGYFRDTGLSKTTLDNTIRQDFLKWSRFISEDYTKHTFFDADNSFTYNYKNFSAPNRTAIPGHWRGIYSYMYDTDRPHSHPWEMLGFSEKPTWWETVYGPAPYTRDNLVLWNDVAQGAIREPGKLVEIKPKFARPTILQQLPVDDGGNLLSPLESNSVRDYVFYLAEAEFSFGDRAPIENAWRRSSEYPFSLITGITLLRPAKAFATIYDRSRQIRDFTGQIVYKTANGLTRFTHKNIEFPNTLSDAIRVYTSGLVNYIQDYTISRSQDSFDIYKQNLSRLQVNLSTKVGGFITKEKFKLVLDSRSPLNQKNIFVPFENYKIILNTSTPVLSIDYSAVIIEKQTQGFVIRGYNLVTPEFKYYKTLETASDPVITIGGISEPFVDWDREKFYNKTQVVRYDNNYYRVTTSHTSGQAFELKYFTKLPNLPITGGRQIISRSAFETTESSLHYGSELKTVQEVTDFLAGYGKWLVAQGFDFEYFNPVLSTVTDWSTATKEFAFWTTQNWSVGSVISLSPGADEVRFTKPSAVVDNIYDSFYEYSIYKQDGNLFDPLYVNTIRKGNLFVLRPRDSADGVYHATLNLVQKEHVIILDNVTVFNDIIYDQVQGYRQERIKAVGYRTSNWQGDFNIPGFIYDRADVTEWKQWKDYSLSDTVKYKEFYYSAKSNVTGTEDFDDSQWNRLPGKPESKLVPNWDYKSNQFFDFYDLDTDSFDVDQQTIAKHLIGYQRRDYLENIINDDIAQYKFYQGMIRDKGTQNVLTKLFDPLSSADKDSLEFYEEWAIRLGNYGATSAFEEVEYKINETKMLINPQPFELVSRINSDANDFVYRILPHEVYVPSENYNHAPFPANLNGDYFVETSGYVRRDDVDYIFNSKDDISSLDFSLLTEGTRIWIGNDKNSWGIYRFTALAQKLASATLPDDETIRLTFASNRDVDLQIDEYIGINSTSTIDGVYKITNVGINYIEFAAGDITEDDLLLATVGNTTFVVYKFSSLRIKEKLFNGQTLPASIDRLDEVNLPVKNNGDLVWIDGVDNIWSVWQYNNNYALRTVLDESNNFGQALTVSKNERVMAVSANLNSDNQVLYFTRPASTFNWAFAESINAGSTGLTTTNGSFASALALSKDGSILAVASPYSDSNQGHVSLFALNAGNIFQFTTNLTAATRRNNELFGFKVYFTDNRLVVVSKGTVGVTSPAVFLYSLTGTLLDSIVETSTQLEITDVSTSSNSVAVSFTDESVRVYSVAANDLDLIDTVTFGDLVPNTDIVISTGSNFAESVALTQDGTTLAVGAPSYSGLNSEQGCVIMFNLEGTNFVPQYLITAPNDNSAGRFGAQIEFNLAGDQLSVYASGVVHDKATTFDGNTTVFDLTSTRFTDAEPAAGAVFLFDKYDTKYVFAENLAVDGAFGLNYGQSLSFVKSIYIGDPGKERGGIYEFTSPTKSWSKHQVPELSVDAKKIKSIFLYDTDNSSVIQYLDFVDPLQGKILGIAEQELSYKTYYDPATYIVGTESVNVDQLTGWNGSQVGRLWWDLSSAKFINTYQGSVVFKANSWNNRFNDQEVAVYEWVSSRYKPSVWDSLADTEEGLALGISGQSKYGDLAYSITQTYDTISQSVSTTYYFWVKNKVTVPDMEGRNYSAKDVSLFIADPKSKGIKYAVLHSPTQFSLVNCKDLITDRRVAINFRYWTVDNTELNIHSHYQLLSEGDETKQLNKYIEKKWLESLIGVDELGNIVPDPKLPMKLKYGILNKPRQSMFINRLEALKQFVERVNSVLIKNNIVDDIDISKLYEKDQEPSVYSLKYDAVRDLYSELRFVNVAPSRTALLEPVVENGRIIRVNIIDSGKNYVDLSYDESLGKPRKGPNVQISGIGTNAKISTVINTKGEIIKVNVDNPGEGYQPSTALTVRPFTALVRTDENSGGKWALYIWDTTNKIWIKDLVQTYDANKYWRLVDWYDTGYNAFTKVDASVDFSYQLAGLTLDIGDIVKIKNVGSSGWMLLLKNTDSTNLLDINSSFKVIGRQNGTLQLNSNIYQFKNSNVGYDGPFFDVDVFDDEPKEELRIIIDVIKNNIFVDQLTNEYNQLFFASLRYVFAEQVFVDWAFKTSFVKSKHNLGELKQKITYQNDNLESYEDYIREVKPYRSKIREFVSAYDKTEQSRTLVADFDLPAVYNPDTGLISPISTQVKDGTVVVDNNIILQEPYSSWYYNVGHSVKSIDVLDGGSGYKTAPLVIINGVSSVPATATAYVSQGKLIKIIVTDPGDGYLTTPSVILDGGLDTDGVPAQTSIELQRGLVRSNKVGVKFDRISPTYQISSLNVAQQFTGTGSRTRYDLKWPADIRPNSYVISVNGLDILDSDFTIVNVKDTSASYTRYFARITFVNAPANQSTVTVSYKKNIDLLSAADRIQFLYAPTSGQLGKDLGQLMQGVDYGGVEVKGLSFEIGSGWDALPWFVGGWDTFDTEFRDKLFISNGSNRSLDIGYVPADGVEINVYKNTVKIDDPNYDQVTAAQDILDQEQSALTALLEELEILIQTRAEKNAAKEDAADNLLLQQSILDDLTAQYNQALLDNNMILAMQIEALIVQQANVVLAANSALTVATSQYNIAATAVNNKQNDVSDQQGVVDDAQTALDQLDPITNSNAIMNSFYGDASTQVFVLPNDVPLSNGDKIILRESTSDGSFRPDDQTFDVDLDGGDLAYASARGVNPEAINVDGDAFVSTTSSHAPEEVVPGQIVDSVDIQVYDKVSDGSPNILNRFYKVTATDDILFAIGQRPGTAESVIVKINDRISRLGEEYDIDYQEQNVRLLITPSINDEISIISLSQNGSGILDLDFFVADGTTSDYVTAARWDEDYTAFVTIDGVPESVTTFIADETFENAGNIVLRFPSPPVAGAVINFTIIKGFFNTISKVQRETIVHDGVTNTYPLQYPPATASPLESNVVVVVDGKLLKSIDNYYFEVVGTSRTYSISVADYAYNSVDPDDIRVYVNGVAIQRARDWNWVSSNNELKLKRNAANVGDKITLSIFKNANYTIENDSITLLDSYSAFTVIDVTTFNNHDILDVRRFNDQITFDSTVSEGLVDYKKYTQLSSGRIALDKQSIAPQYVWIAIDGELLVPDVDYVLENNLKYIRITRPLLSTNEIEVMVFSSNTTRSAFGYRIFKDMTNRIVYKRIDDSTSTTLAEPLNSFDAKITVVDASGLTTPNALKNEPGVIYIDKERIEYLKKTGNILSQIRRGTLGTGIKSQYSVGTRVRDQSVINTVPYKDEVQTAEVVSDGYTIASQFYTNSTGVTVEKFTYDFNNQTAFPLGGQVTTVTGTGFRDNVKIYVGDTECTTTYINETSLTFITPAKSVGAYDLVIYNPAKTVPFNIPATSVVVPAAIKYVQILLPFAPRPNPATETGWYKDTRIIPVTDILPGRWYTISTVGDTNFGAIGSGANLPGASFQATAVGTGTGTVVDYTSIPYEYWESMDIEVFVGGRRLRKSPVQIFDETLGPDSPSGDKTLEAEFAVNKNVGAYVRLTEAPPPGVKIAVQKRIGRTWTQNSIGLSDATSDPAKFIRAKGVDLSE